MELSELGRHWEKFGKTDPLWAVLSAPGKQHGRWDKEAFFESGRVEIRRILERVEKAGASAGRQLPRNRALDFGCGVGRLTQALGGAFERVDGVDIAPSMVELAREWNQHGDRCTYHVNDRDDLSLFADGTFDFVYTAHVLQHMEPRYSRKYVDEFFRLLSPDGMALFEMVTEPVVGATEALPDDAFRANLTLSDPPTGLRPGQTALVEVDVRNAGPVSFPATGSEGWFQVTVANHWLTAGGKQVVIDDGRVALPEDLAPGASVRVELEVTAPARRGDYRLEVDCVQEGVAWFSHRGSTSVTAPVKVRRGLSELLRRTARNSSAGDDAGPVMEMHGVTEDEIRTWVREAGGRVLTVIDWDEISESRSYDWRRRGFLVTR